MGRRVNQKGGVHNSKGNFGMNNLHRVMGQPEELYCSPLARISHE